MTTTEYYRGVKVHEVSDHLRAAAKRCGDAAAIMRAVDPAIADSLETEARKFLAWEHAWHTATEGKTVVVAEESK